uniref:Pectinesterase catalytic domain-containing protein n=1 Tax=Ananas comosus var. bracteatus TaxID=296719 RepID=A0A6V7QDW6_ANACO|nr:unnamed protein product [Ananas comosus var. bracteatus]
MQSFIDDHIAPKGWLEWNGDFALKTLFYGSIRTAGLGQGPPAGAMAGVSRDHRSECGEGLYGGRADTRWVLVAGDGCCLYCRSLNLMLKSAVRGEITIEKVKRSKDVDFGPV